MLARSEICQNFLTPLWGTIHYWRWTAAKLWTHRKGTCWQGSDVKSTVQPKSPKHAWFYCICLIFADSQGLLYLSLPENNPPLCHLRNRVNNLRLEHSQHKHQSSDTHITWELKTCPPSMQVIRTCPPKGTMQPSCSHMARLNPFQSSVHGARLNWSGNPWVPSVSFASVFWFDSTLAAWPSLYSILEGAYISVFTFPKPPQIVHYTTSAQDMQSPTDEFKSRFHRTTDNNNLACRGVEHQQLLLISNGVKSPHYFQRSWPNSTTQEQLKTAAYKFCLEICNDQQETANSVL